MSRSDDLIAVFNRGLVSQRSLGRVDVERISLSAEEQTNWMPRAIGPMSLRPGLQYAGTLQGEGTYIPFIFDNDDYAVLDMVPDEMRIWTNGSSILERGAVSTTVANGTFNTDLASWTDADEGSAASTWATGGYMQLLGTGSDAAIRRQQVTVAGADQGDVHALRIIVTRGPVLLKIGTSAGEDDLFRTANLRTGEHSIAFTPPGASFWIELSTTVSFPTLIDSVTVEAAGEVVLPTPWDSVDALKLVRTEQSGDVIYCGSGVQQRRIERRPNNSWSVVLYQSDSGPFLTENTGATTLTPSAISGEITLTASASTFQSDHVGCLFRMSSIGQLVEADISAELVYTDPILVTGIEGQRDFSVVRAGTWSGILTLQRSVGEVGNWVDVQAYASNGTSTVNDGFDNSAIYYRIGINAGDYTSGTAEVSLEYASGSITGVVRVTEFTSSTVVTGVVVKNLGGTDATNIWAEGAWSDVSGWPTAVAIYQGRLWWGGNGRMYGSVPDSFTNFDPDTEGDAAPINRAAGDGPVNQVNWILAMERLMAGTDQREQTIRSTSFDEPITRSNYNSKASSTRGSAKINAAVSNTMGFFVSKTQADIYELRWDSADLTYKPTKATLLNPEIGEESPFVRIAIQEEPDVRLHCVRADGKVAIMVRDEVEDVRAWILVETDGVVEDVVVMPNAGEDRVFYRVRRTINGSTVRYHEEWALQTQCVGGTLNLQADSFRVGTNGGGGSTSILFLDHLEGEEVVVWADGKDLGTYTVSGGEITVSESVVNWMVGLPYTARYKTAKLSRQRRIGWDMSRKKNITSIGLVLADTHYQGLQYGPSFDDLDNLPLVEQGKITADDTVWEAYEEDHVEFEGQWDADSRICLQAAAPRPCTILAMPFSIDREHR